jgi:putative ABC transport system ATP-binding protein
MTTSESTFARPRRDPANRPVAVRCRGLTKVYGQGDSQVKALRGIDLDIYTGELLMLVGPSGCGKTTLISVIAAILDKTQGECTVYDQDLAAMGGYAKTRYRGIHIGFVFQAFNLIPALTSAQNVAVPLMINGAPLGVATRKAKDLLARVGFDERLMNALPSTLSGGQQQRVAICRALIHEPQLIVCDEPTAALDHDTGQKVMALLREVALGKDRSLVVVTHDARIFGFADRIAHMDDGHIESITVQNGTAPVPGAHT